MSGERFPSWKHTSSIARACGAGLEVLRRVWESSNAHRDNQPRPSTLASALRYLHLCAGSPTPWAISVTNNNTLDEDYVATATPSPHAASPPPRRRARATPYPASHTGPGC
ncbi:hypothetical protein SGLAU_00270 [Streptomyces glaucescens]|uniref:Uncharacterized protein n=1 Tax=Streptomyces glaucescens TaxID=1907 RepID=A0A089WXC7_STRGA|nr:hypothetical protein SGLAU_00270 [Streptomyces glaucescens]